MIREVTDNYIYFILVVVIAIIVLGLFKEDYPIIASDSFWVTTHFFFWFILSSYPDMNFTTFLTISLGWELIERIIATYQNAIPFMDDSHIYFDESATKITADLIANTAGYLIGRYYFFGKIISM